MIQELRTELRWENLSESFYVSGYEGQWKIVKKEDKTIPVTGRGGPIGL
jgi:hypothetical protein